MVAKSGDALLREDAVDALRDLLLPLATVVTPNLPEAAALTGRPVERDDEVRRAAEAIVGMGAKAVVVKGGHRAGPQAVDVLYDGTSFREYAAPRVETTSTHGTGCTFASAIAAHLALGEPLTDAVAHAKEYLTEALRAAYPIGGGHGPVHHFHRFWKGPRA
jgi:hydroxymethylpyrimidine/phosphomethylpyrimidine kinase